MSEKLGYYSKHKVVEYKLVPTGKEYTEADK